MRFGCLVGNGHEWSEILRAARRAEATGWDGVWFADHFMPPRGDVQRPVHEVWSVLSALAAVTDRVRLGSLVCGNTYRNPAVLAKQAVTADHVSGGRLVLGLGAGWQENEHHAYGVDFGTFTERFQRLEEALQLLRGLRSEPITTFEGRWYRLADAPLEPKPVGSLPILIGGGGEKKTLRMVATYADEWNVWADPGIMTHKSDVLDRHCEAIDRDPAEIQRSSVALIHLCDTEDQADDLLAQDLGRPSLVGTVNQLQQQLSDLAAVGVDEVIVPDTNLGEPAARDEILDRFLTEVAAPFRD